MRSKLALSAAIWMAIFSTEITAQDWEVLNSGGIEFRMPTPYTELSMTDASGVYYDTTNFNISVTALPDTTEFKPETQLERSRYYAATAASVSMRLRGKMVANTDSMIDDRHLYYTAIDVRMRDSVVSRYELLQYLRSDTLHGFSCQYILGDKGSVAIRDKFFNSIEFENARGSNNLMWWIIAGGVLLLLLLGVVLSRHKASPAPKVLMQLGLAF